MPQNIGNNFLVGGPSRNGKTTLINVINQFGGKIRGLPAEALFDVFYDRQYPFLNFQKEAVLGSYLFQARYTNENRTNSVRPVDFFKTDFRNLLPKRRFRVKNQVELIASALDIFAHDYNAEGWSVCDLHPEKYYAEYKKLIPSLNLVIVLREPIEAVCANIYFRSYPDRNDNWTDTFEYRIMMWMYSAQTFMYWKERLPDNVFLLSFNQLFDPASPSSGLMSELFEIPADSYKKYFNGQIPSFSFKNGQFYTPEKQWETLLKEEEINTLRYFTNPFFEEFNWNFIPAKHSIPENIRNFERFSTKALNLCKISPGQAKHFIEKNMAFSKHTYLSKARHRHINDLKRFVRTLLGMERYY